MSCKDSTQTQTILGIGMIAGSFLSFVPQMVKIAQKRSSLGLSFFTLWFACTGTLYNTLNDLVLKWDRVECCQHDTAWRCFKSNMALEMLMATNLAQIIVYVENLIFFKPSPDLPQRNKPGFGFLLMVVMVTTPVLITFYYFHWARNSWWTDFLGVVATAGPFFVWIPQIYTTFTLKDPGSLSAIMLFIQCPGNLLAVYMLAVVQHSFILGLANMAAAVQQLILCIMCVYYNRRKKQMEGEGVIEGGSPTSAQWNYGTLNQS